jgi:hypothetical protein
VVTALREQSTPYHLAHGLLDHAEYLTGQHDQDGAADAVGEAREIAGQLGCLPLAERAARVAAMSAPAPSAPPAPSATSAPPARSARSAR